MKELRNIECFAMSARGVLRRLLHAFPRPVDLRSLDLQRQLAADNELDADCAWEDGSGCLVDSTIEYLAAEGIIRFDEKAVPFGTDGSGDLCAVYIWRGCALTSKGFSALNRPLPEKAHHGSGQTIAKVIVGTGKIVGTATVVESIKQLFA